MRLCQFEPATDSNKQASLVVRTRSKLGFVPNVLPSQSSIVASILAQAHARRRRGRAAGQPHPPAPFIVGSPRSGTTLLRLMLDSHPQLAIPPETGFLPQGLATLFGSDERQRQSFSEAIINFPPEAPGWRDFGIERDAFMSELRTITPFHVDEAIRCFYRMYAARFGKDRWGDKTPSYGKHMRAIERVIPEACFIHLIRDGRDAALSLRDLWFAPGRDMATLARQWRRDICVTRRQSLHCRRYMELRYESLVLEPETCLREICDFIEIEYDPAMKTYHRRAAARLLEHQGRTLAGGKVLVTQDERLAQQRLTLCPPDPSRIFRWRTAMLPAERAQYESIAGGLLRALDYPCL
jgi:Sulfotransferase family